MPIRAWFLLVTLGSMSPLAAQTAPSDSVAIHDLARQFSAAYVRGDVAAMAGLYTSDAVIFPERSEAISGRDAIRRYWTLPAGRKITRHVNHAGEHHRRRPACLRSWEFRDRRGS